MKHEERDVQSMRGESVVCISDLLLLELQIDALFTHDPDGRIPLYSTSWQYLSTSWQYLASRAVARKLGLVQYGVDLSLG